MIKKPAIASCLTALFLIMPAVLISQSTGPKHTLIINGQATDVPLIQVNGHPYVGLEAMANALNGSLSSSGKMVALSLPVGSGNSAAATTSATPAPASQPAPDQAAAANQGFSREFLNAGIEAMSTLREWHSALQTAIQGGIPPSTGLFAPIRASAATNLRLASVAANTSGDRGAYQLMNNAFQNMSKLTDKYIGIRANLTYIAPDALQEDDLNKRIMACGRSLGAMAAAGQFSDDGSCH